jgi:hypothetical protein
VPSFISDSEGRQSLQRGKALERDGDRSEHRAFSSEPARRSDEGLGCRGLGLQAAGAGSSGCFRAATSIEPTARTMPRPAAPSRSAMPPMLDALCHLEAECSSKYETEYIWRKLLYCIVQMQRLRSNEKEEIAAINAIKRNFFDFIVVFTGFKFSTCWEKCTETAINMRFGSVDNFERSYTLKKAENFSVSVNQVWGRVCFRLPPMQICDRQNGRSRRHRACWGSIVTAYGPGRRGSHGLRRAPQASLLNARNGARPRSEGCCIAGRRLLRHSGRCQSDVDGIAKNVKTNDIKPPSSDVEETSARTARKSPC